MASITDAEKQPLLEEQRLPQREPTLGELQQEVFKAQRRYMRAWSRTTSGKWHKGIMISVTALLGLFVLLCFGAIIQDALDSDGQYEFTPDSVQLEAHIMSKCPDARDCLHDVVLPSMMQIQDLVDFRLSYIGNVSRDDGVECKHGQAECLGNIIELCAAHLYPVKESLGFTMCLSRQYQDIPDRELIEDCALEHGISMASLNECSVKEDGGIAMERLKKSFKRSAHAKVTKSCTIRVNEKIWCIRDGGKWTDCEGGSTPDDLVNHIKELHNKPGNPPKRKINLDKWNE